ncbi:MAG: TIGR02147 family protein [Proteobacteria bacterium]|nr:MAG: TIGR02147 family protein [Pseudomonadota bacterium]
MNYAHQVKMVLLEELTSARARNPSYSMRAFALRLGVNQSVISQVINGKRPLTRKTAQRILEGLGQSAAAIELTLAGKAEEKNTYTSLSADSFQLVSEWYHFAILSLAETENFRGTPEAIASRLGITPQTAKEAMDRLLRLELLAAKGKRLVATGKQLEAISAVPHVALRRANQDNLVLAEKALAEVPVELRDFTAITLCFDPDRIEDARAMIKAFRRSFDRAMEAGRKREVYKLSIQLFPLSSEAP